MCGPDTVFWVRVTFLWGTVCGCLKMCGPDSVFWVRVTFLWGTVCGCLEMCGPGRHESCSRPSDCGCFKVRALDTRSGHV